MLLIAIAEAGQKIGTTATSSLAIWNTFFSASARAAGSDCSLAIVERRVDLGVLEVRPVHAVLHRVGAGEEQVGIVRRVGEVRIVGHDLHAEILVAEIAGEPLVVVDLLHRHVDADLLQVLRHALQDVDHVGIGVGRRHGDLEAVGMRRLRQLGLGLLEVERIAGQRARRRPSPRRAAARRPTSPAGSARSPPRRCP